MAKYNIYAVGYGINPKTGEPVYGIKCKTWDECKKYINGVTDAKYKGFLTDDEADAWLRQVNIKSSKNRQNKADGISVNESHTVNEEFISLCINLGLPIPAAENAARQVFIDVVKFLQDNNCIIEKELPFN